VLIRTSSDRSSREQWLLVYEHDAHARPGWGPEDVPRSVYTGRTNDEVVG
jgi:bifunctional non-homologous end joining protein LigD